MGEFSGLPPFASGVTIHQQPQSAASPAVPAVEASLPGRAAGGQTHGQDTGNQPQPQAIPQQRSRPDPRALTGPPPAFRVSLLDLERDLAQIIARLEASRSLREGERATAGHAAESMKQSAASPEDASPDAAGGTEFPNVDSMLSPDPSEPAGPEEHTAEV